VLGSTRVKRGASLRNVAQAESSMISKGRGATRLLRSAACVAVLSPTIGQKITHKIISYLTACFHAVFIASFQKLCEARRADATDCGKRNRAARDIRWALRITAGRERGAECSRRFAFSEEKKSSIQLSIPMVLTGKRWRREHQS
jgi:hypothetical protein